MLRRRRPSPAAPASGRGVVDADGTPAGWTAEDVRLRTRTHVPRLVAAGWTLPDALAGDRPPSVTRIGVDGAPTTGVVDARGAVSPAPGRPTLDWAVGADDRWYVPAREPGVEQVRIDHAPVVETRMRVPGGHVVQRVWAARGPVHPGGDEWVHVEVENASKLPVALAWVVRPWDANELADVLDVVVRPQPGTDGSGPWHVDVDVPYAVLPRRPSRWVGLDATQDEPGVDPLAEAVAGDASADWSGPIRGDSDLFLASLAVLVPVPHTATASIALPLGVAAADAAAVGWPSARPGVDDVVRGWSTVGSAGPRVELPDPVLADAVAAARRSLLLAHRLVREPAVDVRQAPDTTHVVTAGGPGRTPVRARMEILEALARWGHHDVVDRALIDWPAGQQRGGGFGEASSGPDEASTAAALRAMAAHAVAEGDAGPARAWLPEVGGAVEWLGRRSRKPAAGVDPLVLADGLDAGALLLALLDQPEAAAAIAADAARAAAVAPSRTGDQIPAGSRGSDHRSPDAPRALAAQAVAATRAGADASAIWALLRQASSTWTWADPERWVGDDLLVPARLLTAVARLLVADRPDGLALTPWMPPAWWGLGWEVHDVPTRWGPLSYAVRWHSGRPAVLWQVGAAPEGVVGEPVLTAPGLDPTWSRAERVGEALLAPVAPPPGVEVGPDVATGGVAVAAPPRSVWRPEDPGPDAVASDRPAAEPGGPEAAPGPPPDDGGSFS